jgi:hypothetical protein
MIDEMKNERPSGTKHAIVVGNVGMPFRRKSRKVYSFFPEPPEVRVRIVLQKEEKPLAPS